MTILSRPRKAEPAPLAVRLAARIARDGPLDLAAYMDACLNDARDGYYRVHPVLGAAGDFITAPLISQMFGELLGLWAAEVWAGLGHPPHIRLIELGPGDGTLMSDAARAARAAPGFLAAAEVILVETSPPLRALQADRLSGVAVRWVGAIDEIDAQSPVVILANEFLDCLPIRQAVRRGGVWRERLVGLGRDGGLAFTAGDDVDGPAAADGATWEWSPALQGMGRAVGDLVVRAGGAALFVDYGHARPGFGDTLQALHGHQKQSPLERPGEADLTAHVDFAAFLAAARGVGARTSGAITQAAFLGVLGIESRATALARANPERAETLHRQFARLIAPEQMGDLFQAACVHSPQCAPPGFERP